jgi:PAT family beta-lactamase induction signal transducer AmpG
MRQTLLNIFFLGFASGLPFLLILSTLSLWLSEIGLSKTIVGLFAWVTLPYAMKFLLSPIIDSVNLPVLTKMLGRRRSWLLCSQIFLIIFINLLGACDPTREIIKTAILALSIGVFSAIQDLTIEVYRIENVTNKLTGYGISSLVLGYKFGLLISGAGTLFLAAMLNSWQQAYSCISLFMFVGVIATLTCKESLLATTYTQQAPLSYTTKFISSLKSFVTEHQWLLIIIFIISYKFADTTLNMMTMPFLLEIGFEKLEIASVAKTFGMGSMIVGSLIGGILISRYPLKNSLLICIILQIISSLLFMFQANIGNDLSWLFVTMGVENFVCGMNQVALIAYLSKFCTKPNVTMYYALLSSIASLARVLISSMAGLVAEQMSWSTYYIVVALLCIPSLCIVIFKKEHFA